MSRYYNDKALAQLDEEYAKVQSKYRELMLVYVQRKFQIDRAREFATHGFCRRLKTLANCIQKVFESIPPDQTDVPTSDACFACESSIQTFVINVFGSLDNLAWIWVCEKPVLAEDGAELPRRHVGLGHRNHIVRRSFSPTFQEYLKGLDSWRKATEDFRDALAHRIPLYIPPFMIRPTDATRYQDLTDRRMDALRRSDVDAFDRLTTERSALEFFRPWMTHSFSEESGHLRFHEKLLVDFLTVEEVGIKLLEELDQIH